MSKIKKIQKKIELSRQDVKDYHHLDLGVVTSKLGAISQLMVMCGEAGDALDFRADEIAAIGLILADLMAELKQIDGSYAE